MIVFLIQAEDFQKKTDVIPNPVAKKMKASSMVIFKGFVSYFAQEFSVIFSSRESYSSKIEYEWLVDLEYTTATRKQDFHARKSLNFG